MRAFPKVAPDVHFDVLLLPEEEDLYITNPDQMTPIHYSSKLKGAIPSLLWQQAALPRLCQKLKTDVLFAPAGNRRLPYWTPCPSVGTFHDLSILHVEGKYDWIHTFYNLKVLPFLVRRLTHVITISECSKRDLTDYVGVPEDRITTIFEAADAERYYPGDKDEAAAHAAERYGIRSPYVLFISRIDHPGKNHVRLIRAFDRLKAEHPLPHQLVFAGTDWNRAEDVHAAAEAAACKDDILFTGFAANEDIPDLYRGADLFVFPSLFEGFGLPILEAMASGTPVACSNTSSLPEVAGDAALLFDPHDEASIMEALRRMLTDDGLKEDYAERGRNRAAEFSWERCARETMDVLRCTVEGRR